VGRQSRATKPKKVTEVLVTMTAIHEVTDEVTDERFVFLLSSEGVHRRN
jgi:hypothetical protein